MLLLSISGCTPVFGPEKDRTYTSAELQEIQTLKNINRLFNGMRGVDVALYLAKEDFSSLVNKTFDQFSQHFTKLNAPGFSKATLGRMQLDFSHQKVRSTINFSFEVDALKRNIFGHLSADHTLEAGKNSFILRTKFDEIVLDHIDEKKPLAENSKNKDLIAQAVKSFMHTLNIEIINMPLIIPVDMNILDNINGKDIASSSDYTLHSARAVNMQTKMETFLPYITKTGVTFLGTSTLQSVQKEEEINDLRLLRDAFRKKVDLVLNESMGVPLDVLQKYTSYYVSKKYLSKQMNLSLKHMDLRVINKFFLKIPEEEKYLKKDIYFFDKGRLPSCAGVKRDCTKLLHSCNAQCELKFGIHRCVQCDSITNPFEKVRCMSKLQACKSKEELHAYECRKREDRCELGNNEILTACEIKNLDYVQMCKEKKEKLLFVNDEIVLAQLNLYFDVVNSYAVQRITQIRFAKGLESLEVMRDIHLSVDSKLQLGLNNSQNSDINCSLGVDESLLTHSQLDYVQQKRELPLLSQRGSDGKMLIKAISKPNFMTAYLENKPYDKLMKKENFSLQCRYQGMPMPLIQGKKLLKKNDIPYRLKAMMGEVELQFEEEELSFVISPVKLGTNILLYPTMEDEAIGFSRQAHFF